MAIGELPRVTDDSEDIKLAPERYKNFLEVQEDCNAMISSDRGRAIIREQVDRQIDGNSPYRKSWLEANNQGWRANCNYRELEGYLQARQTPLFDMTVESNPCIRVGVDWGKGQEQRDAQEAITEAFTWLMFNRWPGFDFHTQMRIREMLAHGPAYHVWPERNNNWIPKTLRNGSVLFPEGTPLNFDEEGERFMVRDYLPSHVLYNFIRNEKTAKNLGWNPDQVWKVLKHASKNAPKKNNESETYQRRVREGDIGASLRTGAWVNWLFVREFEGSKDDLGGISLYAIAENGDGATDYLFKSRNCFEDWPLSIFRYDVGNGNIHGVKGLGVRTLYFFRLSDRIKNAMADQVMISAYPQVKQNLPNVDPDKLKLMRLAALSIIPYGVEPSVTQFPPLGNGPLALSKELREAMESNNQAYSGGSPDPVSRETALSYSIRAQDMTRISKSTYACYYRDLTVFYEKILFKAVKPSQSNQPWAKMAKEFRDRCKRNGAPQEALNKIVEIEATRAVGMGSAALRLQTMQLLMQTVFPNTTEDRKIAILRALTSSAVGYHQVDDFAPNVNDNDLPDNDTSFATLEGGVLAEGGEAEVAPKQKHAAHIPRHFEKVGQILQALQNGEIGPEQAYRGIFALGRHIGQHIAQLEGNPMRKSEYDQFVKQLADLGKIADQLANQIQDAQETPDNPSPQTVLSEQGQIEAAKLEMDSQRKDRKLDDDMARKWRGQMFKERVADVTTTAKLNRSRQLQLTR